MTDKQCDYCEEFGPAYTFLSGETVCFSCQKRLPFTGAADCRKRIVELEKELKAHGLSIETHKV